MSYACEEQTRHTVGFTKGDKASEIKSVLEQVPDTAILEDIFDYRSPPYTYLVFKEVMHCDA